MKPAIEAMYRTGDRDHWVVALGCGHKRTVSNAEAEEEQLYIGKRVECPTCEQRDEALARYLHVTNKP